MEKTEVYSWRLDPELKSALEDVARVEGTSLSRLLDRIATEWLRREIDRRDEDATLSQVRERAMRYVGSVRGKDPQRAANAASHVKEILASKHARRRVG